MISPITNNGIISLTQDTHLIRQSEDTRVDVNYINSQSDVEQKGEENAKTVVTADDSSETDTRHDARDEGKNKYIDLRDKNKKKTEPEDGVVVKKDSGRFDLRI